MSFYLIRCLGAITNVGFGLFAFHRVLQVIRIDMELRGLSLCHPAQKMNIQQLVIFLLVAIVARAQTFGSPTIEFDEQFYLLVGDRMWSGALPYVDIWDRKPIGLFLIFAAIRSLGGDGFLAYQLVAAICVALTAWLMQHIAEKSGATSFGAWSAAIAYILWLNLLQGEGGQASVFYALPMVSAALFTLRASHSSNTNALRRNAMAAMMLVGLAMQIKYTAAVEGIFFGCWLLWSGHRLGLTILKLGQLALTMVLLALFPTCAAGAAYAAIGHFEAFLFANFTSVGLRGAAPLPALLTDLAVGLGIVIFPLCAALYSLERSDRTSDTRIFLFVWLIFVLLAILLLRSFSPHYFIPLLLPMMIAAAPAFAKWRRISISLMLVVACVGQALLAFYDYSKGGRAEAQKMVEAIGPVPNCLYVHNGFPSLYQLSNSRLPTRFIFPGHLNTAVEAKAIGVDPVAEVARILANKPDAIVTDLPVFSQGNTQTQALVDAAVARDYQLVLKLKTGKARYRLVYRLKQ